MKTIFLIILPVILLSVFLAGGFSSPFPQQVIIPSSEPRSLLVEDSPEAGKQLQLKGLRFASPSPRPSPSLHPSSSPQPSTCAPGQNVAIDMLLDTSGSMKGSKIAALNSVVNNFFNLYLQNNDVIGIQEFSSSPNDVVPINKKINNLSYFPLVLGFHNYTYMNDAMMFAREKLLNAKSAYPNYRWVLIFLSDGKPETSNSTPYPDPAQDPTGTASIIKTAGVRIITIGLEIDKLETPQIVSYARKILTDVASSPSDFHDSTTTNLGQIYADIAHAIACN